MTKLLREKLDVGGHERSFVAVVPDGPVNSALFFFHGSMQSGNVARRFTGGTFDTFAESGTLVVYPNGVHNHFNDYRAALPEKTRELGVDDVAFTETLVTTLRERFGFDDVYACGFSNGGHMVIRLLFDAPRLLSGAAIFSATLAKEDNITLDNPPSAYQPTPLLFMHGDADRIAPIDGGQAALSIAKSRGSVRSAMETCQWFADVHRNRPVGSVQPGQSGCLPGQSARLPGQAGRRSCQDDRIPNPAADTVADSEVARLTRSQPYQDVTVTSWSCAPSVELWAVHGMGHVIPSGKDVDPRLGASTDSFLAADIVRTFFAAQPNGGQA